MLSHSHAYKTMKDFVQADMDVAILICHAVPALKGYMKACEAGQAKKLPDPDHFKVPQPNDRIKSIVPRYKKVLGRMMFIALFSYFESYFKTLVNELINFHGGKDKWSGVAKVRLSSKTSTSTETALLREPYKKTNFHRYHKAIRELEKDNSFRFPSEQLAVFGILTLSDGMGDMRSVDIQRIANFGLGVTIAQDRWNDFDRLRNKRNKIAHEEPLEVDLAESISAGKFLTELAKDIDDHVVKNLMILERP